MNDVFVQRVDWTDTRAAALRDEMEAEMNAIYAGSFDTIKPETRALLSSSFDVIPGTIIATVAAFDGDRMLGQAGLRWHGVGILEVKKVMVDVAARGRGISRLMMVELELVARELGVTTLILQTGDRQPAAINLYESLGYVLTPPYAPFELMTNALCYSKSIC